MESFLEPGKIVQHGSLEYRSLLEWQVGQIEGRIRELEERLSMQREYLSLVRLRLAQEMAKGGK